MHLSSIVIVFIFFFQAEDGIRDTSVTGVQTCALPIYITLPLFGLGIGLFLVAVVTGSTVLYGIADLLIGVSIGLYAARGARSEERRVGKECRRRWRARR